MTELYAPASQSWIDHGFAFLSINYRGSTTFGRAFLEQIWGNLGRWEVEDMVAAREWLVKEGIADASRVFVTGWSYGGYLTLQALGTRPALWAGGMAGIAVADWAIAHEDTTETLRGVRAARFGGTPQEQPERYAASSPITYAKDVQAPVLIIQGRNDTRTPRRSVDAYEATMKARLCGCCGSATTIGTPRSPAARMSRTSGMAPRNGTPNCRAISSPPPWPKISARVPQPEQT